MAQALPEEGPVQKASGSDHDTLKYHLLGPSLTKAGQESVDQQKVSEIIYNASKGSKFFNNEEVKDRNLTQKIERMLARRRHLEKLDLSSDQRKADDLLAELELGRDLSQTIVHIDCDAFYAAVEELDRPELKTVPMAVGKGVLTTCNYQARKFGCRSGMASFVAKKLCPELICLPMNFEKYTAKAQEVRSILVDYDPRFESASIDEAYLNITEYCQERSVGSEEVVNQLRLRVAEETKITVSAGIAPNAKLAKIASNKNKPNGQFRIPHDRGAIMEFMRDLPTRKVNGIGRVFERELEAVGIKTCGDIFDQRAYLAKLFGEKAFEFLMQCYLGLGRTKIQPAEDYERKSVGTESTFKDMKGKDELRQKLRATAEELEKDLLRTECKGRTLVLKVKLHTYEVLTRQVIPPKAVHKADDLYNYALPMLSKLEKEISGMTLRLMGLRVTHLVSTKKGAFDLFGAIRPQVGGKSAGGIFKKESASVSDRDTGEWEVWPEEEFEEAAREEQQQEMEELEHLSQEYAEQGEHIPRHGREIVPNPKKEPFVSKEGSKEAADTYWQCPICLRPQPADEREFNSHIDFCLSRGIIKEAVEDFSSDEPEIPSARGKVLDALLANRKDLKRPRSVNAESRGMQDNLHEEDRKQRKLFF